MNAAGRRKARLGKLGRKGYMAGLWGEPCDAPTTRELERAAWEMGWRIGKKLRDEAERIAREEKPCH